MTAQDPYQPRMQPPAPQAGRQQPTYGAPQYQPYAQSAAVPNPAYWPHLAAPAPAMVDGFVLVQPKLKPIPSGPAIGSLVAGIGGVLAALPGLVIAAFSPLAGLAFFMLSLLVGGGAVVLASYGRRQIRRAYGGVSGRGMAMTGLILGIVTCSLAAITALISAFAF